MQTVAVVTREAGSGSRTGGGGHKHDWIVNVYVILAIISSTAAVGM